ATLDFVDFHQDTTIIDGSTYYYFLQSRKVNFPNSDYTPVASGFVSQLQAPTGVMASDDASPTTITISWTHSTGSQVPGGYRIFRAPAEDGPYFNIGNAGYVE